MPVPKLNADRCKERNLAAAAKGLNSSPVTFSVDPPDPPDGWRVLTATKRLPRGTDAVEAINANVVGDPLASDDVYLLYPEVGSTRFIPDRHMFLGLSTMKNVRSAMESGVSFMNSHRTGGMSTEAELPYGQSFAGQMETLVNGDGDRVFRVIAGVFLRRGLTPNGANGPTTDDLFESIRTGSLQDVSLGFSAGGSVVCDVCGNDVEEFDPETDWYVCTHVPGTTFGMEDDEVKDQKARGVPKGVATCTLEDFHPGEVSAVYDGAIPGAGFRKAMRFARRPALAFSRTHLDQAHAAYAHVLNGHSLAERLPTRVKPVRLSANPLSPPILQPAPATAAPPQAPRGTMPKIKLNSLFAALAGHQGDEIDLDALAGTLGLTAGQAPPSPPAAPPAAPQFTGLVGEGHGIPGTFTLSDGRVIDRNGNTVRAPAPPAPQYGGTPTSALEYRLSEMQANLSEVTAALEAERTQNAKRRDEDFNARVGVEAEAWAEQQVRLKKLTPAERVNAVGDYRFAAYEDSQRPVRKQYQAANGTIIEGSRLDAFKASFDRRPAHNFTTEFTVGDPNRKPAQGSVLPANAGDGDAPTLNDAARGGFKKFMAVNGLNVAGN